MELNLTPALQKTIDELTATYEEHIRDIYQSSGITIVRIAPEPILEIASWLKESQRFIYLADVFGTDRYTSEDRFEVVYNLFSFRDQQRLFLKVWLPEENPVIESVTQVWRSANWFEREVFDMFGIRFLNHPDPRRMYMPEDYDYHPLRKEFPLLGVPGSIDLPSTTPETE